MNLCYSSTLWHHSTVPPTAGAGVPAAVAPPPGMGMPLPQAAPAAKAGCGTAGVPGCSAASGGSCAAAPAGGLPAALPISAQPAQPASRALPAPSSAPEGLISADSLNDAAVGELLGMRIGNGGPDEPEFTTPRDRLLWAMERTGWVQAKAGRLLGLTTRQVSYAL